MLGGRGRDEVSGTGPASADGPGAIAVSGSFKQIDVHIGLKRRSKRWPKACTEQELDIVAEQLAAAVERDLRFERQQIVEPIKVPLSRTRLPGLAHYEDHVYPDSDLDEWNAGLVSSDLGRLITLFEKLPHRRMVLIGESGAGKTELARELTLRLLERRRGQKGEGSPVPLPVGVLLPLDREELAGQTLDQWIATQILTRYGSAVKNFGVAFDLVRRGQVLPVLDGLETWGDTSQHMVSELNEIDRQVIVTCRTLDYANSVLGENDDVCGQVLTGAPVIELRPVPLDEVERRLRMQTRPDRECVWTRVFGRMRDDPRGHLATALSTPFMIWLAEQIYARRNNDPDELLDLRDRREICERLLDQFIPAVYLGEKEADRARRYLTFLAYAMEELGTNRLAWWELTRLTPLPVTGAAFAAGGGVLACLAIVLGTALARGIEVGCRLGAASGTAAALWSAKESVPTGIVFGLIGSAVIGALGWLAAKDPPLPVVVAFGCRRQVDSLLQRLIDGFWLGIAVASVFVLVTLSLVGPAAGWPVALAAFAVTPLSLLFARLPGFRTLTDTSRAVLPSSVLKQDRRAALVHMLSAGTLTALLAALFVKVIISPDDLPPLLAVPFVNGLAAAAIHARRSAWAHFLVARTWLACSRRLPWRLMRFLDDAYADGKDGSKPGRQVLRRVGGVYQFRHDSHRTRLAAGASWRSRPRAIRSMGRPRKVITIVLAPALTAAGLVVLLHAVLESPRSAECEPSHTAVPVSLLVERHQCVLRPSSSVFTNHRDKIDLDSGQPGQGASDVHIGYKRKGGLAEVIADFDRIGSPSGAQIFVRAGRDRAPDPRACRPLLSDMSRRVSEFGYGEIRTGDRFCVETDERHVALVRVMRLSTVPAPRLVISFWVM